MLLNSFLLYFKNLSKIWLLFLFYFCFFCIFFSNFALFCCIYLLFDNLQDISVLTPQLLHSISLMHLIDKEINLNPLYDNIPALVIDIQVYYIFFLISIICVHIIKSIKHIFADYIRDIEIVSYQIYFLFFFILLCLFFCNNSIILYLSFADWFCSFRLTWKFSVFMFMFNIIQLIYIYILINKFKTQMLKSYLKNLVLISLYVAIYFLLFAIAI